MHKNGVTYLDKLYSTIERLCDEQGITVTELCRRADVSRGNLTDLKMGRQKGLSAKNANKIANYFGVSVGYLLGTDDTKKAPTSNEADERIRLTQEEADLIAEYRKLTEGRKEAIRLSLRAYQESE